MLAGAYSGGGGVVVLSGPLGAGKTVFAKGLAHGLGIASERVTSPTFAIACEYPVAAPAGGAGVGRFVHVDGYRLASARELEDAGLLDWLAPDTLVAIEWGERFAPALPADRLEIVLSRAPEASRPTDDSLREIRAVATGAASESVRTQWRRCLQGAPEFEPFDAPDS